MENSHRNSARSMAQAEPRSGGEHLLELTTRRRPAVLTDLECLGVFDRLPGLGAIGGNQPIAILVGHRGALLLDEIEQVRLPLAIPRRHVRPRSPLPRV